MFKKLIVSLALVCAHKTAYSMETSHNPTSTQPSTIRKIAIACCCIAPSTQEDLLILQNCAEKMNACSQDCEDFAKEIALSTRPRQKRDSMPLTYCCVLCSITLKKFSEKYTQRATAPTITHMRRD